MTPLPFTYAWLPRTCWPSSQSARGGGERGDFSRGLIFGGIAVIVVGALYEGGFWLTGHLEDYAELGDFLLRMGLQRRGLFLTFLSSFLETFSGIVTALSTFFLSEDLRLLLAAPIAARRLFYARFVRTAVQSSWMVVRSSWLPVLMGDRRWPRNCAPASCFYVIVAADGRAVRRSSRWPPAPRRR